MDKFITLNGILNNPLPEKKKLKVTVFHKILSIHTRIFENTSLKPQDFVKVVFVSHYQGLGDLFLCYGTNPDVSPCVVLGVAGDEFGLK